MLERERALRIARAGRSGCWARSRQWLGIGRRGISFERCGIGFGGPVEFERQRVALSTHVGGWSDFDLPRRLEPLLGLLPVMDNDANAGALGEALYGAGRGFRPLFYMTLSTGIGGGIIPSGETIYRGADSYAGEIGHITIRPDGPECLCGWHGLLRADVRRVVAGTRSWPAGEGTVAGSGFRRALCGGSGDGAEGGHHAAESGADRDRRRHQQGGRRAVVPLRAELRRQITTWSRARIDVVPAALGDDSVLYGAMALAGNAANGVTVTSFPKSKGGCHRILSHP